MSVFSRFGFFAMTLTIFVHVDYGMAEQEQSSVILGIGEAYEFKGVTKYLSSPSKILFPDKHFLASRIVDAYDYKNIERNNCDITGRVIGLKKDEVEWWQAPVYRMLPEAPEALPNISKLKTTESDIVIILNSDASLNCEDDKVIDTRRFVISSEIAKHIE